MPIRFIKITQDLLNKSTPGDCGKCVVAAAMQLEIPIQEIRIGFDVTTPAYYISKQGVRVAIEIYKCAKAFIDAFDNHIELKPTVMLLEYLDPNNASLYHMSDIVHRGSLEGELSYKELDEYKRLMTLVGAKL